MAKSTKDPALEFGLLVGQIQVFSLLMSSYLGRLDEIPQRREIRVAAGLGSREKRQWILRKRIEYLSMSCICDEIARCSSSIGDKVEVSSFPSVVTRYEAGEIPELEPEQEFKDLLEGAVRLTALLLESGCLMASFPVGIEISIARMMTGRKKALWINRTRRHFRNVSRVFIKLALVARGLGSGTWRAAPADCDCDERSDCSPPSGQQV